MQNEEVNYIVERNKLVNDALLRHFDMRTLLVGQCDIGIQYGPEPNTIRYYAEPGTEHEEYLFKMIDGVIEHNQERLKRIEHRY